MSECLSVGPEPFHMICPTCGATIETKIKLTPSTRTHLVALFLCAFLCWSCVFLPYVLTSCQNSDHYCPECNAYIASYQR